MARKTKEEKRIDSEVEATFNRIGSGIQFDIMDLSKIADAGRNAGKEGKPIEPAMQEAISKYRKN